MRGQFLTWWESTPHHDHNFTIDLQQCLLINCKIGNCQGMLNHIQHALTIVDCFFCNRRSQSVITWPNGVHFCYDEVAPSAVFCIRRWGCRGATIVSHQRGALNNQQGWEASSLSPPSLSAARQAERQQQWRQQGQQGQSDKRVVNNLALLDTTISLMLRGQGGTAVA